MQPPARQLIIFTRYPEPGRTKTRLIPALGAEGAALLYRRMALRTVMTARRAARRFSLVPAIYFSEGEPARFHPWLGPDLLYAPQAGGDLGARMDAAFRSSFAAGFASAVLIGADVPGISEEILGQAFASLERHDLVLGPATDGGYYLIGLKRPAPELFAEMTWGTDNVLRRTIERARGLGLALSLLEPLSDVDRPEDLPVWERAEKQSCNVNPAPDKFNEKITIIIPALNEEGSIASVLAEVTAEPGAEVIVADGGSGDSTCELAASYGAKVVTAPPGRARQMNAGAEAAQGAILLFLHADTHLPAGFSLAVRKLVSQPGIAGGAFSFRLDKNSPAFSVIERLTNFRSRWLGLPYGDQALFLKATLFREIQGFPDIPVLEDLALVRRLRRAGRIETLPLAAVTSSRRWLALGVGKTLAFHMLAMAAYGAGVSPVTIHHWFREFGYDREISSHAVNGRCRGG